jgi:ferredoxin
MNDKIKCRFRVDRDLCIAVSACIVAEPDIYILDDEAKAIVKPLDLEDMKEVAREANNGEWVVVEATQNGFDRIVESARVCPVLAIFVEREVDGAWVSVYPE